MTAPINLNRVRKAKSRQAAAAQAAENRVRFGLTKAEKAAAAASTAMAFDRLDNHRRDT
jgi:hypothetical protein